MALTEERIELTTGDTAVVREPLGVFKRPQTDRGWKSWFTTVDHKKIGIMYGAAALVFFALGGLEALAIRMQLAAPNGEFLSHETYNQMFTMHGTTMIFLVVMPLAAAFANYLIPLQIGARDVAFPRINAFGFWCFLFGGLFLYASFFLGGAPNGGWFNYVPNSLQEFSEGHGIDFWAIALIIAGIASTTSAVNLIVTVINMRAPGMTLMRMPIFTWMMLVTQFLLLFALPVITVALFLLMFNRLFDANFFEVDQGADPLLWQHLFWIFGHPEVYILILPAFGIVSEIIPTFARKPLFGYPFMVFSGIAIGFMGWGVWVHHMFASGVGPVSVAAFSLSTMFIAVPTGVKIFNWLGTMWGGNIRFTVPMLFAIGLVTMFTIGGLSGVTHSISPHDAQQTDTYYIVAHFHYVLFGGALFGLFGGFYFWWPKMFGRRLSERTGELQFWLMLIGFNLTFGPFHILGLQGMPRRTARYAEDMGWDFWNLMSTFGAFIIALSFLVFIVNVIASRRSFITDPDPWDARSLEWMTDSPPPTHNFDEIPTVTHLDEYFHRKYAEDENGRLVRVGTSAEVHEQAHADAVEHHAGEHMHMPSPSYWPFVLALGLPIIGFGLIYNLWLCALGGLLVLGAFYGWGLEPSVDPDAPPYDPDANRGGIRTAESAESTGSAGSEEVISLAEIAAPESEPMTVPGVHGASPAAHHTSTGLSNEKLAMWAFLGSECLLFGGLISTYLLYRNRSVEGPTPSEIFDIPFTSVSSFVLLMSSLTMVLAASAIQRGDHQRCRTWLVTTAALGCSFIAGQVYEFTSFVREGLGYTTNIFGSAFYTLTGFHGVHVSIGILMLMSLVIMSLRGRLPIERAETVEIVGLYWHFVDVVWIIIFTVVYLIPE